MALYNIVCNDQSVTINNAAPIQRGNLIPEYPSADRITVRVPWAYNEPKLNNVLYSDISFGGVTCVSMADLQAKVLAGFFLASGQAVDAIINAHGDTSLATLQSGSFNLEGNSKIRGTLRMEHEGGRFINFFNGVYDSIIEAGPGHLALNIGGPFLVFGAKDLGSNANPWGNFYCANIRTSAPSVNGTAMVLLGRILIGSDSKPYWEIQNEGNNYYIPAFFTLP